MKRLFVALCLVLTACGGSSAATCEFAYWDGTIGTCLPAGWNVLEQSELADRGIPSEVVTAFQSQQPYAGQFATITVTGENVSNAMTSSSYSDATVASVKKLPGYKEIDVQSIDVDGETVALHIFTAQPRTEQPSARFYQLSAVSDGTGYTFTAATPVSVDNDLEDHIMLILENVTFVEIQDE